MSRWFDRKMAKIRVDNAVKHVIGDDPARKGGEDALQAQRFNIASAVRQWFDGGYEPLELIRMLLSGACFVADNVGVTREQLVEVIRAAGPMKDAQLIFKP